MNFPIGEQWSEEIVPGRVRRWEVSQPVAQVPTTSLIRNLSMIFGFFHPLLLLASRFSTTKPSHMRFFPFSSLIVNPSAGLVRFAFRLTRRRSEFLAFTKPQRHVDEYFRFVKLLFSSPSLLLRFLGKRENSQGLIQASKERKNPPKFST